MAVELHVTRTGKTSCVALLGEFEPVGVEQLRARLEGFQDDDAPPVVDLRDVVLVDADSPEYTSRALSRDARERGL